MIKNKITVALFTMGVLTSIPVLAAFSPDDLHAATKLAVADLFKSQPEHAQHFYGYKSWKSGEESKVKVYISHENMTMEYNFTCHKHDEGIECHAQ